MRSLFFGALAAAALVLAGCLSLPSSTQPADNAESTTEQGIAPPLGGQGPDRQGETGESAPAPQPGAKLQLGTFDFGESGFSLVNPCAELSDEQLLKARLHKTGEMNLDLGLINTCSLAVKEESGQETKYSLAGSIVIRILSQQKATFSWVPNPSGMVK